jgi:hypothetical protein
VTIRLDVEDAYNAYTDLSNYVGSKKYALWTNVTLSTNITINNALYGNGYSIFFDSALSSNADSTHHPMVIGSTGQLLAACVDWRNYTAQNATDIIYLRNGGIIDHCLLNLDYGGILIRPENNDFAEIKITNSVLQAGSHSSSLIYYDDISDGSHTKDTWNLVLDNSRFLKNGKSSATFGFVCLFQMNIGGFKISVQGFDSNLWYSIDQINNFVTPTNIHYGNNKETSCIGNAMRDVFENDGTPVGSSSLKEYAYNNMINLQFIAITTNSSVFSNDDTSNPNFIIGNEQGIKTSDHCSKSYLEFGWIEHTIKIGKKTYKLPSTWEVVKYQTEIFTFAGYNSKSRSNAYNDTVNLTKSNCGFKFTY